MISETQAIVHSLAFRCALALAVLVILIFATQPPRHT